MVICPFWQSEAKAGFKEKPRKKQKCNNYGGFVDKYGRWRNSSALTVFDLRLKNVPSEANFGKITATNIGFLYKNRRNSYDLIKHLDYIGESSNLKEWRKIP